MPKINTDKIIIKGFSLPLFKNIPINFNLDEINDSLNILAQPLIIKKNNKLFCNYKTIYYNTGPISPELFNELCHLKIYSLADESLNIELEKNEEGKKDAQKENQVMEKEIINEIIKDNENEIIERKENIEKKIKELNDTDHHQYMKVKSNIIEPKKAIDIEFSYPPPNNSKEEIIYRLKKIEKFQLVLLQ